MLDAVTTLLTICSQWFLNHFSQKENLPSICFTKIRQMSPDTYCFSFCIKPGKAPHIIERIEIPGWKIAEVRPMWKNPEIQGFVLSEDLAFADSFGLYLESMASSSASRWASMFGRPKASSHFPMRSHIALKLACSKKKVLSDSLLTFTQVTETR